MTAVFFYVLGKNSEQDRLVFCCRLIAKAYREGRRVYIHTQGPEHSAQLDDLLWQFQAGAFIPHAKAGTQDAPVLIGHGEIPAGHDDVLINLSDPIPGFFSRFERVMEIVIQDEAVLNQTRQHYKFYRDRGYDVTHHDQRNDQQGA
ncbi:MAG: DNA polymerase III subunit chi [Oceanospirillaceae bacterium]|nr:DNA polymerase III subunit chi [Oceanospirillaceae bacterium]